MRSILATACIAAIATPALAQSEPPQAFVISVYQALRTGVPNAPALRRENVYDSQLVALWKTADTAVNPRGDDVGAVDYEPLCGCQDEITKFGTKLLTMDAISAKIAVGVWFAGQRAPKMLTLSLVKQASGWRIADVEMPTETPSLRAYLLTKAPKQATRTPTPKAAPVKTGVLSKYVGQFAFDKVRGVSFLTDPVVRRKVAEIVPDTKIRATVLSDIGPSSPLELRGGWIGYGSCFPHNCDVNNWRIDIAPDGAIAKVCYFEIGRSDPDYPATKQRRQHYATWYTKQGSSKKAGDCAAAAG